MTGGTFTAPAEVLGVGDADRAPRRWPWVVLVVLVVVAGALWWLDARAHRNEIDALTAQVQQGQQALAQADALIAARTEYGSPLLNSGTAPAALQTDLRALVTQASADGAAAVALVRGPLASTGGTLPWHDDVAQARAAYLAYLDARLASLRAGAVDYAGTHLAHPEFVGLLARARESAVAAAGEDADAAAALSSLLAPGSAG